MTLEGLHKSQTQIRIHFFLFKKKLHLANNSDKTSKSEKFWNLSSILHINQLNFRELTQEIKKQWINDKMTVGYVLFNEGVFSEL